MPIKNQITDSKLSKSAGPGGATSAQACAACKYQRRRCAPDCPLAPYFPVDKQTDFLNAHKLFGVKNITNTLKKVPQCKREVAVRSILYEANKRAEDPVHGSYKLIRNLQNDVSACLAELNLVRQKIQVCKMQKKLQSGFQFCDQKQGITEYNQQELMGRDHGISNNIQFNYNPRFITGHGFNYDRRDGISNENQFHYNNAGSTLGRFTFLDNQELGMEFQTRINPNVAARVDEEEDIKLNQYSSRHDCNKSRSSNTRNVLHTHMDSEGSEESKW